MEMMLHRRHLIAGGVAVVLVGSIVTWALLRPKPAPWLDYPTDGPALVTQYLNLIHQDNNAASNQAYKLVDLPERQPNDDGHLQVYHNLHNYLTFLFGDDWSTQMKVVEITPGKNYEVQIGTETLHVDLVPQGPPDGPPTNHLGIAGIQEFPLAQGGQDAQMAAVTAILGGVGGPQAKSNLLGVIASAGNFSRFTPMQIKQAVLIPVLQDPANQDMRRMILHLWPVRKDPTVIISLKKILDDQRYAPDARKTAQQVLDGTVDETELIAAGVE